MPLVVKSPVGYYHKDIGSWVTLEGCTKFDTEADVREVLVKGAYRPDAEVVDVRRKPDGVWEEAEEEEVAEPEEQNAVQETQAVAPPKPTRTFVTSKNETVVSDLSDTEAVNLLRSSSDMFARDLVRQFDNMIHRGGRGFTDRQLPYLHKLAMAAKAPAQAKQVSPTETAQGSVPGIVAFLEPANKSLKSGASVTFHKVLKDEANPDATEGMTVQISRCRTNSRYPGSYWISDGGPYGQARLFGRIGPDGTLYNRGLTGPICFLLDELEADPVSFVMRYGVRTGRCCFCDLHLEDENSVKLGYGPVCAKHYKLPHGKKGLAKLAELQAAQSVS